MLSSDVDMSWWVVGDLVCLILSFSLYHGKKFWKGNETKYLTGTYLLAQVFLSGKSLFGWQLHRGAERELKFLVTKFSHLWLPTEPFQGSGSPYSVVVVRMPMATMPEHTLIIPIYRWAVPAPSALWCCSESFPSCCCLLPALRHLVLPGFQSCWAWSSN